MRVDEKFNPAGVLLEAVAHNGDGTGTRTVYNPDGSVASTEPVTGLPVDVVEPDPLADIAAALPAATLEEVNDLLAQVIATIGGQ